MLTKMKIAEPQTEKKEKQYSLHKDTKYSIEKRTTQKFTKKIVPKPNPWRDNKKGEDE